MKNIKFLFVSLLVVAALISCDKNQMEKGFDPPIVASLPVILVDGTNNGGNIECEEVSETTGCEFEFSSGRLNYDEYPSGSTIGPITWTTDGTYVTWSSTVPVKIAIIVKGGNDANVYFAGCEECLTGGSGLSAPVNSKNGKPYGLSNITFCYTLCEEEEKECQTAFARKTWEPLSTCFLDLGFSRWGWTNGPIAEGTSWYNLYAGAGQCDVLKATKVGMLRVVYNAGSAEVTYLMDDGFTLDETQLYIGNEILPKNNGSFTVAPGQYPYKHEDLNGAASDVYNVDGLSGELYVVAHAVVCGSFPDKDED